MDGQRTAVRHHDRVPLDPTPRTPAPLPPPAPRALLTVTGEDRPGVTESPAAWPAFTERVFAHAAAEPVDTTEVPDPETDAETTVVEPLAWEFEVGDLARWWDEAVARLDAVARGEDPDRPW